MAELIWDGKYDEHGNKRAPVRIELPFQTVETVNESAQERQRTLKLSSSGNDPEWRNRLIWGDKKYVLPTLLPEFAGKADLIYIDPPFGTGADFSFMAGIPESEGFFEKEPSILEQKAYRDTWGSGTTSYVRWFSEAVIFLRQLLSDEGSIYVHLDFNVGHYAKVILDEQFSSDAFRNEIVWRRTSAHANVSQRYGNVHDVLLYYAVKCIEQRLDSETVTCGKQGAVCAVPEHESEFTAQFMKALYPDVLIKMQCDLAIGASTQAMA